MFFIEIGIFGLGRYGDMIKWFFWVVFMWVIRNRDVGWRIFFGYFICFLLYKVIYFL